MPSQADRIDFSPAIPPGAGRALAMAIAAHLLLVLALTWGVSWKRQATPDAIEAELWSSLPQQAAPKLQEPPPAAKPQNAPPAKAIEKPTEKTPLKAPDIALEKEKNKIKVDPPPPTKPETQVDKKSDTKAEKKPEPTPSKAEQQAKFDKEQESQRQKNLERLAGLAGSSGSPSAKGNSAQSSGPSASYAGLIKKRVKDNLVFAGNPSNNPQVTVEIQMAPDGTIVGRPRIVQSSGNKEWDEAVVRAFEKTEVLPRDNGKVWSPLEIKWRVND